MRYSPRRETDERESAVQTILLVEDEVMIRLPIADYLRDNGFRVQEAANVTEAKLLLESGERIDLVFTDVHMPGLEDGIALAQWVTQRHPTVPVLVTSGRPLPAGAAGRFYTLPKPYSHETAAAHLRSVLSGAATNGIANT